MALTLEPATVTSVHTWDHGLFSLTLDRAVPFQAGQFLTIAVDPEADRHGRRPYSVASAPGEPLEFLIVQVDGGALSPLLARLSVGDTVWTTTRGKGLFGLHEVPSDARRLWMVATGTGVAPYVSMLREGAVFDRFEQVVLLYGARTRAQLAYRDELRRLEADAPLRVIDVVSREAPHSTGIPGRVTTAFASGALEATLGHRAEPGEVHVMLCGNPAMIGEMMELLAARGMCRHTRREPGHITTEKYW